MQLRLQLLFFVTRKAFALQMYTTDKAHWSGFETYDYELPATPFDYLNSYDLLLPKKQTKVGWSIVVVHHYL